MKQENYINIRSWNRPYEESYYSGREYVKEIKFEVHMLQSKGDELEILSEYKQYNTYDDAIVSFNNLYNQYKPSMAWIDMRITYYDGREFLTTEVVYENYENERDVIKRESLKRLAKVINGYFGNGEYYNEYGNVLEAIWLMDIANDLRHSKEIKEKYKEYQEYEMSSSYEIDLENDSRGRYHPDENNLRWLIKMKNKCKEEYNDMIFNFTQKSELAKCTMRGIAEKRNKNQFLMDRAYYITRDESLISNYNNFVFKFDKYSHKYI